MGEAGFDETAPVTLDGATPTANEDDPATVFATLTAKVLAPNTNQLADSSSTLDLPSPTSLDSAATDLALPSSSDVLSERIFNIPSASAAPGKVLRPSVPADEFTETADSPTALETVESVDSASVAATATERVFAPAASSIVVKALQSSTSADAGVPTASATVETAPPAATSDKIFNPTWSSVIYAVAASSSEETARFVRIRLDFAALQLLTGILSQRYARSHPLLSYRRRWDRHFRIRLEPHRRSLPYFVLSWRRNRQPHLALLLHSPVLDRDWFT
jgi:hypothetical protein